MTLHTFPALQFRPSYGRFSSRTAGTLLIVIICSLLASTGRAEVSMTFAGYKISYSSGSFNTSEEYGQQFIDVENLVISSQQGERLSADRLMLKATGTLHSLDWIEQADIINANLNMPPSSGHEIETRIETIQIKNMHLSQPESLSGFAERLHKDRVRPGYLRLANVFLLLPESGLLVEIEELVADSNPDLMNSQLPRGQHVSEAAIVKARLLPSGSGETSLMFRFMLNGLGLDALTIDARASALSKFTSGQFDGEFRLELDADKLLVADLNIDTVIDDERYQQLLSTQEGGTGDRTPEQEATLAASLFKAVSLSLRDAGALRIYDSLSSSFGLPDRRQLALLTEYQIQDSLSRSAGFLAAPVADFIRTGGTLTLSAEPRALTESDFSGDDDVLVQTLVDKAELSLIHTP